MSTTIEEAARVEHIRRNLETTRNWSRSDFQEFYHRDVEFLLSLVRGEERERVKLLEELLRTAHTIFFDDCQDSSPAGIDAFTWRYDVDAALAGASLVRGEEREKRPRKAITTGDALELWHNTGGFACSFPEDCVDALWALAAAYVELATPPAADAGGGQDEKQRRIYYQDIVYTVCNQLDRIFGKRPGRGIVCGTLDTPTKQVQEHMEIVVQRCQEWASAREPQGMPYCPGCDGGCPSCRNRPSEEPTGPSEVVANPPVAGQDADVCVNCGHTIYEHKDGYGCLRATDAQFCPCGNFVAKPRAPTPPDVAAARDILAKMTPGEWEATFGTGAGWSVRKAHERPCYTGLEPVCSMAWFQFDIPGVIDDSISEANARGICYLRNNAEKWLDQLAAVTAENERLNIRNDHLLSVAAGCHDPTPLTEAEFGDLLASSEYAAPLINQLTEARAAAEPAAVPSNVLEAAKRTRKWYEGCLGWGAHLSEFEKGNGEMSRFVVALAEGRGR